MPLYEAVRLLADALDARDDLGGFLGRVDAHDVALHRDGIEGFIRKFVFQQECGVCMHMPDFFCVSLESFSFG